MSLIIPANSLAGGGYQVDNSLRFNSGSSDYLVLADGTPTDALKWTYSTWVKRSTLGGSGAILGGYEDGNNWTDFYFTGGNELELTAYISSSTGITVNTNARFRDVSAWYHIVLVYDSANGTASNRVKIYVNGVLQTINTATYPSQNYATKINASGVNQNISFSAQAGFNGYIAETYFIDGQALTPTDFGEFDADSGVWKPIAYEGTYGTNGFFLEFQDSGALGTDSSGEGNDFTVNNLTSIDQTTDTPTNNFATLNGLAIGIDATLSEGNLKMASGTATSRSGTASSIGFSQGKWFAEFKILVSANGIVGIAGTTQNRTATDDDDIGNYPGRTQQGYGYLEAGSVYNDSVAVTGSFDTFTTNDIIGVAVDVDNDLLYFYKNGAIQNSGTGIDISGITPQSGNWFFAVGDGSGATAATVDCNFGNAPYTITTGNADANGYGNFEYAVPSGYYALNTKNLAEFG
jgi:hypothetical protein